MIVSLDRTDPISNDIAPSGPGDPPTLATCFRDRLPTQQRRGQRGIVWPERRRLSREMIDSANKKIKRERGAKCTINIEIQRPQRGHESKGKDITILSFRISCAHSRRMIFSKISTGKPKRLSEGLPAVMQVEGLRGRSVFADAQE